MSIAKVGVLVTCPSEEELRERAADWSELGDPEDCSASGDLLLFEFALFADLATGERLLEVNDGGWAFQTGARGGGIIELDEDRPIRGRARPLSDLVSEHVRGDLARARSAEGRWAPLVDVLKGAGHNATAEVLDTLPFEVEFAPSAVTALRGPA